MEGDHRKVANVQANFCSPLDPQRVYLSKPTLYTLKHFTQVCLNPRKGIKDSHIIGAYNIAIKLGAAWKGFFYDSSTVGVGYLKKPDIAVPDILDACCIYSKAIGRGKQNSATKDPFVELAGLVSTFMRSMSEDAILYCPCLEIISFKGQNKFQGPL